MAAVHYHEGRFPPESRLDWPALIPLIGPAVAALVRYDGTLGAVPNPRVLLSPLTTHEAVLSSRIEGTQATMSEVLEFEAGQEAASPQRRDDIHEVLNYRNAMRAAERALETLPLCQRVVREAHQILLSGVRGESKSPGDYRRLPNWIGPPGCTVEQATFVPIGADKLPAAMGAWESYLNQDAPDRLVQLAILHAEFEALHPFLDGNGRLGRMLVPLFLWQCGLITQPMFYISAYFEARHDAYYDGLLAVSRDDAWTEWCRFFLEAVRAQAEENLAKAKGILTLYEDMKGQVARITRSQYAIHILDWIFEYPIFNSTSSATSAEVPSRTARRLLNGLREHEILRVIKPVQGLAEDCGYNAEGHRGLPRHARSFSHQVAQEEKPYASQTRIRLGLGRRPDIAGGPRARRGGGRPAARRAHRHRPPPRGIRAGRAHSNHRHV